MPSAPRRGRPALAIASAAVATCLAVSGLAVGAVTDRADASDGAHASTYGADGTPVARLHLVADHLTSLTAPEHTHGPGAASAAAAVAHAPKASVRKAAAALTRARAAESRAVTALRDAQQRHRTASAAVTPTKLAAAEANEELGATREQLWAAQDALRELELAASFAEDDVASARGAVSRASNDVEEARAYGDAEWLARAQAELAAASRELTATETRLAAARSALTDGRTTLADATRRVEAARVAADAAETRAEEAGKAADAALAARSRAQQARDAARLATARARRTLAHARAPRPTRRAPYALNDGGSRNPARWDACSGPITVRVSTPALTRSRDRRAAVAEARRAVALLKRSSRLPLVFTGTTKEVPRVGRQVRTADIVVSYTSPRHSPGLGLEGSTVGAGGSWFQHDPLGNVVRFAGMAAIDVPGTRSMSRLGVSRLSLTLHELGHAVGLGHVADPRQVMNPTLSRRTPRQYARGDRNGLKALRLFSSC